MSTNIQPYAPGLIVSIVSRWLYDHKGALGKSDDLRELFDKVRRIDNQLLLDELLNHTEVQLAQAGWPVDTVKLGTIFRAFEKAGTPITYKYPARTLTGMHELAAQYAQGTVSLNELILGLQLCDYQRPVIEAQATLPPIVNDVLNTEIWDKWIEKRIDEGKPPFNCPLAI